MVLYSIHACYVGVQCRFVSTLPPQMCQMYTCYEYCLSDSFIQICLFVLANFWEAVVLTSLLLIS